MIRPSREELLVETAFVWAKRSTCSRLNVGAVIHRDGRVLVQGYNGAPAGTPHCSHECTCEGPMVLEVDGAVVSKEMHRGDCPAANKGCTLAVHAEANAIAFAARWGVGLMGAEIVTTHQPCYNCATLIINSGITRVLYVYPYRLEAGVNLLREAGLVVEQYLDWEEPSIIGSDE